MKNFKEILLNEKNYTDDELDSFIKYAVKKIDSFETPLMNKMTTAKPNSIDKKYINNFLPVKLTKDDDLNYVINGIVGNFQWVKTRYFK